MSRHAIVTDIYEWERTPGGAEVGSPTVRHVFYGRTLEEAKRIHDAHRRTDAFLRGCEAHGRFGQIVCSAESHAVSVPGSSRISRAGESFRTNPDDGGGSGVAIALGVLAIGGLALLVFGSKKGAPASSGGGGGTPGPTGEACAPGYVRDPNTGYCVAGYTNSQPGAGYQGGEYTPPPSDSTASVPSGTFPSFGTSGLGVGEGEPPFTGLWTNTWAGQGWSGWYFVGRFYGHAEHAPYHYITPEDEIAAKLAGMNGTGAWATSRWMGQSFDPNQTWFGIFGPDPASGDPEIAHFDGGGHLLRGYPS
jgi:hypothetical protein